jgi:hypothetical protein
MDLTKRFPLFEIVLVTVILVIHTYAALSDAYNFPNAWFTRDDAYYYFKVAQNITEGHGVTFDGINPTNGYHPLWMVVCIPIFALARLDLILPLRVMLMVMAVLNAATAILIYRMISRALSPPIGMIAASFWAFNTYIHYTVYEFGLETPLAAFGVVWLVYQLSIFESEWRTQPVKPKQIVLLSIIAVITLFSRLDLVFLAVLAGIWIILRGKPMRFLLPMDMVAIYGAMVSSFALRTGFPDYYTYVNTAVLAGLLALIIKIPALYFLGLYQHPRTSSFLHTLINILLAILASSVVLFLVLFLLTQIGIAQSFPRVALVYDFALSLALMLILRLTARWFSNRKVNFNHHNPIIELKANWKKWATEGALYYGILGGALAVYMLYNKLAFGAFSPVSGQIKRWWGSIVETAYDSPPLDWTSFFGISFQRVVYDAWQPASTFLAWLAKFFKKLLPGSNMLDERFYLAMILTAIVILLIFIFNHRRALQDIAKLGLVPLIAGCGIHIFYYTTSGYAGAKEWYWVSQMILVTFVGSVLLDLITRPLSKVKLGRVIPSIASIIAGIYLAFLFADQVVFRMPYNYYPPEKPYMDVLPFIEENTPAGSIIGMTGGGNVGYFIHDRVIVNMDGLINSYAYFQALQNGTAPIHLKQKGVDIVFANPSLLEIPPYNGQFTPYLQRFGSYGGKALMILLERPGY